MGHLFEHVMHFFIRSLDVFLAVSAVKEVTLNFADTGVVVMV